MTNEYVYMHLDCGRNICRGLLPVGTEHPVQITSAYSVCECVCEEAIDHCDSLVRVYLMMWGLFMKSWPTCGREGKKSQMGRD